MKLDLQKPYSDNWRLGYLVINKEQRKTVILYNNPKDRSSVSYARYLMAVHLGRMLTDNEHVDHINNDRTDDRLENLQILSQAENNRKSSPIKEFFTLKCDYCGIKFTRERRQMHGKHKTTCCSRKCSVALRFNK